MDFLHFCNEIWGYTFNYIAILRRVELEIFSYRLAQPIANDQHL
jgi:hypothetical protein